MIILQVILQFCPCQSGMKYAGCAKQKPGLWVVDIVLFCPAAAELLGSGPGC